MFKRNCIMNNLDLMCFVRIGEGCWYLIGILFFELIKLIFILLFIGLLIKRKNNGCVVIM